MSRSVRALALAAAVSFSQSAFALISYELDYAFSGDTPAGSVTASFETVSTGSVKLTLDASVLGAGQNMKNFYFNYTGASSLSFSTLTGDAPISTSVMADSHQADGDGKFDVLFEFSPPPGQQSARFLGGEVATYLISGSGITEQSFFDTQFDAKFGNFYAAAHIQQTAGPEGSGWIAAIPEPETYAMLLAGLGLLGFAARRRMRAAA